MEVIQVPAGATPEQFMAAIMDGTAADQFRIDTMEKLEWYGRKLTAKQAEIDAVKANAEAIIKGLEKDLSDFQAFLGAQAESFVARMLEATSAKTKTLKTLGGAFSFRTVNGGLRKVDPAVVLEWAKEKAPALVQRTEIVKEDVPAADLKAWQAAYIAAHEGEYPEIPGTEIVPDRETFTHKATA